ncbi:hypothetical protein MetMK1DRAFT_00003250 [Metallosphaera yellowstonensis MK1]|jgi:hypothetical protein|uniref:Uncharacterized protein n=2 Tax=Metallosphaera TaxID=41980 RepID=H2C4F8_9CREN|nr:hypothetical protein MetMK1DRAFT_00003250 [Metallosphaera yellowstonensis MK1]
MRLLIMEDYFYLLEACVRCYNACKEDFESTVRMISEARGLDPEFTKRVLLSLKERYGSTERYRRLRAQLPEEFPL